MDKGGSGGGTDCEAGTTREAQKWTTCEGSDGGSSLEKEDNVEGTEVAADFSFSFKEAKKVAFLELVELEELVVLDELVEAVAMVEGCSVAFILGKL